AATRTTASTPSPCCRRVDREDAVRTPTGRGNQFALYGTGELPVDLLFSFCSHAMEAQRFTPKEESTEAEARRRIWRRRWTKAIRICGGDVRAALRATLVANSFLEGELERLTRAISRGFARGLI